VLALRGVDRDRHRHRRLLMPETARRAGAAVRAYLLLTACSRSSPACAPPSGTSAGWRCWPRDARHRRRLFIAAYPELSLIAFVYVGAGCDPCRARRS